MEKVRLDATTISGHHLISEEGLFQFGHSKDAIAGKFPLIDIKRTSFHHNTETSSDKDVLETIIATGYEVCRCVEVVDEQLPLLCWQERVLIIHSPTVAKQQLQGLETRLHHAQQKLMALTPQQGRGKRQIRDLQVLLQKATVILRQHRVEGLLSFDYECQETVEETYIGRGRPTSPHVALSVLSTIYSQRILRELFYILSDFSNILLKGAR